MARSPASNADRGKRAVLVALAVCCVVPMLAVLVLTSVVGIAVGPAAAISVGFVAAGVCIAVMVQRRRAGHDHIDHVTPARGSLVHPTPVDAPPRSTPTPTSTTTEPAGGDGGRARC